MPYTEQLLAAWRAEIVQARIELADDALSLAKERELWAIVDCREASIQMSGANFAEQLERIDHEIAQALRR